MFNSAAIIYFVIHSSQRCLRRHWTPGYTGRSEESTKWFSISLFFRYRKLPGDLELARVTRTTAENLGIIENNIKNNIEREMFNSSKQGRIEDSENYEQLYWLCFCGKTMGWSY